MPITEGPLADILVADFSRVLAGPLATMTLADLGGYTSQQSLLRQSLSEEQRMATWVLESLPDVTRKYASLRAAGETASH